MGVWTDIFVAPAEPALPSREAFGRFVTDLGRERIVRTPWYLLAGRLDVNTRLLWSGGVIWQTVGAGNDPRPGSSFESERDDLWWDGDGPAPWGPGPRERATVLAMGESVAEIVPALARAPYGVEDIVVVFASLDFGNPAILEHYWFEDHRTVLACYALAQPQRRWRYAHVHQDDADLTDEVAVCLVNTFKFGDEELCPAIEAVVSRRFGPDLVSGRTLH